MTVRTSVMRGLAFIAAGALTFTACDDKSTQPVIPPAVTVTVSPQTLALQVGGTGAAVASVQNATTNPAINWRSSNTAVATVSPAAGSQVTITAVAPGNAVITAFSAQDTTARAGVAVTVTAGAKPTITLTPPAATIVIGGTVTLVPTVSGSANTGFTCRSAAAGVASVNATSCVVTGVAPGTAVITALAAADTTVKATSTITVNPVNQGAPVVTVTPSQATATPGGTVQFVANVTNAQNTAVTWRSSVPFVTVSNTGLATVGAAATPGSVAVITAVSAADTLARGSATLNIAAPPPQPSISIQSVTIGNTFTPVNPAAVAGPINATVNVSAVPEADIRSVEVRLDGTAVCTQTFSQPLGTTQGVAEIICPINTAALDANGVPVFPNGTHVLTAVAIKGDGTVITTATFPTLTFVNANVIALTIATTPVTSTGPVVGSTGAGLGLLWNEGNVDVTARPAIFTPGTGGLGTLTLCITTTGVAAAGSAVGASCRAATAGANNTWTASFPKASAVGGANNGSASISNTGVTATATASTFVAGGIGPTNFAGPTISVDNFMPTPAAGTLVLCTTVPCPGPVQSPPAFNGWVGANYQFLSGYTGAPNDPQPGVDAEVTTFHVGAAASSTATIAATAAVVRGSDVAESPVNTTYALVVKVVDALGNVATLRMAVPATFGVDLTGPVNIVVTGPADMAILQNNAATLPAINILPVTWTVTGQDALSGPGPAAGWIRRLNPNGTTTCVVGTTPGLTVSGGNPCNFILEAGGTFTIVAGSAQGYYTFRSEARDQAGNAVAVADRVTIIDTTIPAVQNIVLPSTLPSGGQAAFSATATDNLDLWDFVTRTLYADGVTELPYSAPMLIDGFGPPLVQTFNMAQSVSFIRSIEFASAAPNPGPPVCPAGVCGAPTGVLFAATGQRFTVRDHALNNSTAFNNFAAGTVPAGSGAAGLGVADFGATGTPAVICDPNGPAAPCGATPTASALTATVRGTSGTFNKPFSRVIFYRVDVSGAYHFIGETANALSSDSGVAGDPVGRVWTYSGISLSAAGFTGQVVPVVAVGVDATGDALISNQFNVTVN